VRGLQGLKERGREETLRLDSSQRQPFLQRRS
jgi:hypothetical protein